MTPEFNNPVEWLAGLAVGLIAFFAKRELNRVSADLANKADKDQMQRELEGVKMDLKETREARERDIERLERAQAEKLAEFSASMRDRLTTMERNVNDKINGMREDMSGKLDMIMQVMRDLRKE